MKRKQLTGRPSSPFYFADEADIDFIPSGCTLLDCILGGGWPIGQISNIVGDKSSGKTLISIEACANMRIKYPKAAIHYDVGGGETFDLAFARHLGLPEDGVSLYESGTVEEWYNTLSSELDKSKGKQPMIYVMDSLDALSDEAERKRKIDEGTYGTKAKQVGEILRRLDKKLSQKRCLLLIVSQIRDNIGVTFGKKYKRSGGKALDFWAAQCLWLAEVSKITKTRKKIKRAIGINVKAKCEKNKVGLPFRDCEFPLIFNYGMDDEAACKAFLDTIGVKYDRHSPVQNMVRMHWLQIEQGFLPKKRKYP